MSKKRVIHFTSLDSTNKYIKEHLYDLEPGTIVSTDYQTAGYGRLSRSWLDQKGTNLTFSVFLKETLTSHTSLISQLVAASLIKALEEFNIHCYIKWPNDILLHSKKVAGILVETVIVDKEIYLIIGIGLNVNTQALDPSIESKATSILLETNKEYDRDIILQAIMKHLDLFLSEFRKENYSFMNICRERNALLNQEVYINQYKTKAIVKDIDNNGHLVLKEDNTILRFSGSEVTLTNSYQALGDKEWLK